MKVALLTVCTALSFSLTGPNIRLVDNSGQWSTYPFTSPANPPGWLINESNSGTVSFMFGTVCSSMRAGNGTISEVHSCEGSYAVDILTSEHPTTGSLLFVWFKHKIAGSVSVGLIHASDPGGSEGEAKSEVRSKPDDVISKTSQAMGVAVDYFGEPPPSDGWKERKDRVVTFRPSWSHVGADWIATVRVKVPGTKTYTQATSPVGGAEVTSLSSAKSHLMADRAVITAPSSSIPGGIVVLDGWGGSGELPLLAEYVRVSDGETKLVAETTVAADGDFSLGCDLPDGAYNIYVTVNGFLRKKFANINIEDNQFTSLYATLINGDINRDNEVNLADYALLSNNLGLDSNSTTWDRMDENFIRPRDCDLDGDMEVTLADYAIITASYNQGGD